MADSGERESLLGIFLMEAWDTLATLEDGLWRLRAAAGPATDLPDPLVVVTHRLKGTAALYGFLQLAEVAGVAERVLDSLPGAPPEARGDAADFLADLVPVVKKVLDAIGASGQEDGDEITAFTGRYPSVFARAASEPTAAAPAAASVPATGGANHLLESLDPLDDHADILAYFASEAAEHLETMTRALLALEQGGDHDVELGTLFRAVHTLKGAAYTVGRASVGDLAHRIEDLLAAVREARVPFTSGAVEGVFAGVDALRLLLSGADGPPAERPGVVDRAVEQLTRLVPASPEPVRVLETTPAAPALPSPAVPAAPVAVVPRGTPGRPGRAGRPVPAGPGIRVNVERLDALMNLVGELVIARSRLDRRLGQLGRVGELLHASRARMTRTVGELERRPLERPPGPATRTAGEPPGADESVPRLFAELEFDRYDDFDILARRGGEISADLAEVQTQLAGLIGAVAEETARIQRLTGSLRDEITQARMVPVGKLFARFARHVREASRAAGKTVALQVSGESVEVDNTVIDQIADPLLHLVQNAIVHGIEPADERRARGKSAHGRVYLSAYHQGGSIYVEVGDDGRGVDVERLTAEAVRQGFLGAEVAPQLTEREALSLMFLPGFSTASLVTTAAGRGVGLDVVRTNVSRLSGEIDVKTEVGVGTRFTLKLPLTVVISDALMVRAGAERLAIPLSAVRLVLRVRAADIQSVGHAERIRVDDELLDFVRLDRVLGLPPGERSKSMPVVVLHAGGRSVAMAVDALGGKEEIVIKSLGDGLAEVGPFAGATISGEGRVILLVDPLRLVEMGDRLSRGLTPDVRSAAGHVPAAPSPRAAETARRVLLVDDSVSVRKFVGRMLERAGFRVITANDGAEALERLQEAPVDAVITDLEMPRIDGYELIRDLRRRPSTRALPIVVLTTRAGEKHASLARQLGVEHYVSKPVDEHAFVRLIDALTAGAVVEAAATGA